MSNLNAVPDPSPIDPSEAADAQAVDLNLPPDGFGKPFDEMTERQILEEIAYQLRSFGAAMKDFQDMGPAGILKMLMPGKTKKDK